jgi:hypothetical protein
VRPQAKKRVKKPDGCGSPNLEDKARLNLKRLKGKGLNSMTIAEAITQT